MIVKKKYKNSVNINEPDGYWQNFYVQVVTSELLKTVGKTNRLLPSVLYEAINDALKPYKAKLDGVFTIQHVIQHVTVIFENEAAYAWFRLKWS